MNNETKELRVPGARFVPVVSNEIVDLVKIQSVDLDGQPLTVTAEDRNGNIFEGRYIRLHMLQKQKVKALMYGQAAKRSSFTDAVFEMTGPEQYNPDFQALLEFGEQKGLDTLWDKPEPVANVWAGSIITEHPFFFTDANGSKVQTTTRPIVVTGTEVDVLNKMKSELRKLAHRNEFVDQVEIMSDGTIQWVDNGNIDNNISNDEPVDDTPPTPPVNPQNQNNGQHQGNGQQRR